MKSKSQSKYFKQRLVLSVVATLFLAQTGISENRIPPTVLSFEGSYFSPRRDEFKELYGKEFPVVGVRLDIPLMKETSLSIKGRYLRMSEIDSLVFTNISLGLLLKRTLPENDFTDFYLAGGIQIEYRRVGFTPPIMVNSFQSPSFAQWEIAPSVAVEGGIDLWILSGFKISPSVGFHYFPFGDPTTGDFGDTGGFMFSASLGFRL